MTTEEITQPGLLTKQAVVERVADWIERLNTLFEMIEAWAEEDGRLPESIRGTIVQRNEPLLDRFHVRPHKLPTLTFLVGRHRLAFVPSALWVVGANGRVNISLNGEMFTLYDMGENHGKSSDWKIISLKSTEPRKFDRKAFKALVSTFL